MLLVRSIGRLFTSSDMRQGAATPLKMVVSQAVCPFPLQGHFNVALEVLLGQVLMEVVGGRNDFSPELSYLGFTVLSSCGR